MRRSLSKASEGEIEGWRALSVESDRLAVVVLPERGAEVHSLVHVPTATELLFQAPWGLQRPSAPPREGSDGHAFLEGYAGGWQELFVATLPRDAALWARYHALVVMHAKWLCRKQRPKCGECALAARCTVPPDGRPIRPWAR